MSIGTILLILLVLLLVGALPSWPYSSSWGYYPSGGLGLLLIVLLVLVVTGPKDLSGKPPAPGGTSPGEEGADSVVAHLSGGPTAAFTINPDKEQAKPLAGAGDLRWTWDVRPRQEGPQRLILELDTTVKTPTGATTKGGIYRQFVLITVQAPSWYEAARRRVIAFFSGGP